MWHLVRLVCSVLIMASTFSLQASAADSLTKLKALLGQADRNAQRIAHPKTQADEAFSIYVGLKNLYDEATGEMADLRVSNNTKRLGRCMRLSAKFRPQAAAFRERAARLPQKYKALVAAAADLDLGLTCEEGTARPALAKAKQDLASASHIVR